MKKRFITLFVSLTVIFFCPAWRLQADPVSCMIEGEAEQAAEELQQNPWLIQDCYFCKPEVWKLIRVDKTEIRPCRELPESDEKSLLVTGIVMAVFGNGQCGYGPRVERFNGSFAEEIIFNYVYSYHADKKKATMLYRNYNAFYNGSTCTEISYPTGLTMKNYNDWYAKKIGKPVSKSGKSRKKINRYSVYK